MKPPPITGLAQPWIFAGLRVHIHPGDLMADLAPAWYDLPRRFGWRKLRTVTTEIIPRGKVLFLDAQGPQPSMIIRADEWDSFRKNCTPLQ